MVKPTLINQGIKSITYKEISQELHTLVQMNHQAHHDLDDGSWHECMKPACIRFRWLIGNVATAIYEMDKATAEAKQARCNRTDYSADAQRW